jgi:hypothetical protein
MVEELSTADKVGVTTTVSKQLLVDAGCSISSAAAIQGACQLVKASSGRFGFSGAKLLQQTGCGACCSTYAFMSKSQAAPSMRYMLYAIL